MVLFSRIFNDYRLIAFSLFFDRIIKLLHSHKLALTQLDIVLILPNIFDEQTIIIFL